MKTDSNILNLSTLGDMGLYVHIPFCKQKCMYCDFPAYQNLQDYYETYGIITTKFGSVDTRIIVNGDERQYPAGIAHFLEHKVFEDENGQDYLKKFVHLGSESNAFTSFTKTSYL